MSAVFITVLNMSLTASYAALAVIIVRYLLKKAPKVFSYALWLVVLLRLIIPFSFTSSLSLLPGETNVIPQEIVASPKPAIKTGIDVIDWPVNQAIQASFTPANTNHDAEEVEPVNEGKIVTPMGSMMKITAVIWLLGIVVLLGYSFISYFRLKQRLSFATLVRDNIFESDLIQSPFVLGFIKPRVYLPSGLANAELSYILQHEETHIKRKDHLIKPVALLAVFLHWFNPVIWLSYFLMIKDMEMSCDEKVIKESGSTGEDVKANYSTILFKLAVKQRGLFSPLSFGESNVKARIQNILNYKEPKFWFVIAAIALIIFIATGLLANPAKKLATPLPSWVREFVYHNRNEYKYAHQNGYFYDSPIIAEDGEVKLTIWAALTNPLGTDLIYTVEGVRSNMESGREYSLDVTEINGKNEAETIYRYGVGWLGSCPQGEFGVMKTQALAPGKHELTVVMQCEQLTQDLVVTVPVDAEAMRHLYQTRPLYFEKTIDGITVNAEKLIVSPFKVWVDINVTCKPGTDVFLGGAVDTYHVVLGKGAKLQVEAVTDNQARSVRSYIMSFDRPKKGDDIKLIIPALMVYDLAADGSVIHEFEPVEEFIPTDIGQTKYLHNIPWELKEWRYDSPLLEFEVFYGDNEFPPFEWKIAGADGEMLDVEEVGYTGEPGDSGQTVTHKFRLIAPTEGEPVKIIAVMEKFNEINSPFEITIPLPDLGEEAYEEYRQPYNNVQEAFTAVMAKEEGEFYFDLAIFDYRSPESYKQKRPVYIIVLREGEIVDGFVTAKAYEVAEELIDLGETKIPMSTGGVEHLKQTQDRRLEACFDRTHAVIELAKEQGRDLAEEAFLMGSSLKGSYNGDWYIIAFDSSLPQAAYNLKTDELVVAKDATGMSFVDRPQPQ